MQTMKQIGESIKDIISNEHNGNIYDYHVAAALEITVQNHATLKHRNKIDLTAIVGFALRHKISLNYLLLKIGKKELLDATY